MDGTIEKSSPRCIRVGRKTKIRGEQGKHLPPIPEMTVYALECMLKSQAGGIFICLYSN